MESKRLATTNFTTLPLETTGDIEVPKGAFHYHITQNEGELTYTFHLRYPDTTLFVTGLVTANQEATPTLHTSVIHHAPETRAETLIRTLVRDTAAGRYTGHIRIEKHAQNCQSYLNHHSLLLGETAKSWSLPSLEILANEVQCSHAATIRTITDLDLFYLQSRGLAHTEAEQLLIEAFCHDVQV